jgi:hypothetical protein
MYPPCGHPQGVAGSERHPIFAIKEHAVATVHDVKLVLGMRLLRIVAARCVDLHRERAMAQQLAKALAPWPRQLRQALDQ